MNAAASLTFQVGEGTSDTMAVSLSELNMVTLLNNSISGCDNGALHDGEVAIQQMVVLTATDGGVPRSECY